MILVIIIIFQNAIILEPNLNVAIKEIFQLEDSTGILIIIITDIPTRITIIFTVTAMLAPMLMNAKHTVKKQHWQLYYWSPSSAYSCSSANYASQTKEKETSQKQEQTWCRSTTTQSGKQSQASQLLNHCNPTQIWSKVCRVKLRRLKTTHMLKGNMEHRWWNQGFETTIINKKI